MTTLGKTRGNNHKIACQTCNWKGKLSDTRTIQHPTDIDEEIVVCPHCGSMNKLDRLCSKYACWKRVSEVETDTTKPPDLCFQHGQIHSDPP